SLALFVVMALARWLGERWWLPGAAILVAIAAAFLLVAPYLESETEPLADAELVAAADDYREQLGLGELPVRVLEVAEDTRQANAYAIGIGPTRRVVLWDTVLRDPFQAAERRAILAHELAHHARGHLLEGIGWFAVFAVPGAWLLMRATRRRGGMGEPRAVPLALLVVVCLELVAAPATNLVSRRMEIEADWTALEVTRDPAALEGLMLGLSRTSLGDPTPPRWVQLLAGTHPSLADRVALARAWAAREGGLRHR
ncbi:MAG: M48 family metalloprotease, partial [Thermoleophilia bacterium]|nr:M48 family metalloprotease [Thermoleophilia bacterium]